MSNKTPDHVLIVDDDYAVRNYIGTFLQRQRYRVSSAVDARTALKLIDQDRPDVMILDHYLPDMTGEDLLDVLRNDEDTKPLPVILLTIDGSRTRFRSSMNRGADDFLTKPVKPKELSDAVAAQLRKHKLRQSKPGVLTTPVQRVPGLPPAYRVLGTLAQGGSATAYIARSEALSADCVVKIIPLSDHLSDEAIARFSREGSILKRLSHPNIVRLHEHGVYGEYAYLAMEYLSGGTLKQLMGAPWEARESLRLVLKLAQGLSMVHAAGVIHRDIKPDNVMLRADSLEPVLVDFGASKDLLNDSQRTAAGTIMGTPSYMAPEIITGKGAVPASDVYACGVLLYELLTGSKPFVANHPNEILHQHLKSPIPPLPQRLAPLQPLLTALMAKNAVDRPASGDAMAALVAALLQEIVLRK
jgi:CheY-like chemotaxis protein/tRNA A-37 threonylcarbamoyl transferase component Bud32